MHKGIIYMPCGPQYYAMWASISLVYKDSQGTGASKGHKTAHPSETLVHRMYRWELPRWKSGPESNLRPPQIVPKSVCLSTSPSDLTEGLQGLTRNSLSVLGRVCHVSHSFRQGRPCRPQFYTM